MVKPFLGEVRPEHTEAVVTPIRPAPRERGAHEVVSTKIRLIRGTFPHPGVADAAVNDHFELKVMGRVDSIEMKEDSEGRVTKLVVVELLDFERLDVEP